MKIVTVYHGTIMKRAKIAITIGMSDIFVTTSPFSAHHFGLWYGEPVILKLKVPLPQIYWAYWNGIITGEATMDDIVNEDEGKHDKEGNQYLFVKGFIPSKNITILPKEKMIHKVQKEEKEFAWESRMPEDIFGIVDF